MLECISDGDVLHWIEFALIEIWGSVIIVTDGDVTGGEIDIFCFGSRNILYKFCIFINA